MAGGLGRWIGPSIIRHDREHGANLNATQRGSWYGQINRFTTYRAVDDDDDHTQIEGIISDAEHHVLVSFADEATRRYEHPEHGLSPRRLTGLLRHTLLIKEFRIRLSPLSPSKATADRTTPPPEVSLHILDFEDHNGTFDSPVQHDTTAVGLGENDAEVVKVLNKWWLGESDSNPQDRQAATNKSKAETDPQSSRITWQGLLEPHMMGSAKKPIADYLFAISDDQKRELDEIVMFGVDTDEASQDLEGSGKPLSSFSSPAEAGPSGEPKSATQPQRTVFDALNPVDTSSQASQSTPPRDLSDQSEGEDPDPSGVESETLSEHEREQRRIRKGKRKATAVEAPEDSLPPSTHDADFSLSRYAEQQDVSGENVIEGVGDSIKISILESEALLHSDPALGVTQASQHSLSNARKRSRSPTPQESRIPSSTRPMTVESYEEQGSTSVKKPRPDHPVTASQSASVLSFLNPLRIARAISGHTKPLVRPSSTVKEQHLPESVDVQMTEDTESRNLWLASPARESQHAGPGVKNEDNGGNAPPEEDSPDLTIGDGADPAPPIAAQSDLQASVVSTAPSQMSLSDLMPIEADLPPPRPKLDGFRPDFSHPGLLTNRDIAVALAKAELKKA